SRRAVYLQPGPDRRTLPGPVAHARVEPATQTDAPAQARITCHQGIRRCPTPCCDPHFPDPTCPACRGATAARSATCSTCPEAICPLEPVVPATACSSWRPTASARSTWSC